MGKKIKFVLTRPYYFSPIPECCLRYLSGMYKVPFLPWGGGGIESSCWGRKSSKEEGKGRGEGKRNRRKKKGREKGKGKGRREDGRKGWEWKEKGNERECKGGKGKEERREME